MLEQAVGTDLNDTTPLVIIGAGAAGVELAFAARQSGWRGPITLLGDEAAAPYHRPPLSKGLHKGPTRLDDIALRPPAAYAQAGITLQTGEAVTAIDRAEKLLQLASGACVPFGRLALCTGGRPRKLPVPGAAEDGSLLYLRTHADAEAIRICLRPGARLVVIGGGYVGLEVAAAACLAGAQVSVLEAQDRLLARVASPELSAFYEGAHRAMGVDIRTSAAVAAVVRDATGRATGVMLADETALPADMVVVGVGMLPNVELAAAAGLAVDGGIVVDETSATSDPAIFAAGDCTVQHSALYDRRVRLESVPNALSQARAAAFALCGAPKANATVPWFWSDQYGYKLQMVGLHDGYERCTVRGDVGAGKFTLFYLRGHRIVAAASVNRPGDFLMAKRLVAEQSWVDAAAIADDAVPLKAMLARAA